MCCVPLALTGAYSHSLGVWKIREQIAEFITERDGYPCNVDHVFLLNGASDGIRVRPWHGSMWLLRICCNQVFVCCNQVFVCCNQVFVCCNQVFVCCNQVFVCCNQVFVCCNQVFVCCNKVFVCCNQVFVCCNQVFVCCNQVFVCCNQVFVCCLCAGYADFVF